MFCSYCESNWYYKLFLSHSIVFTYKYHGIFCVLLYYLTILSNSLIISSRLSVGSFVFFIHKIIWFHLYSGIILTSSFPTCMLLISFSWLITLAQTSKTVLGSNGHPCFSSDFSGNALSFSLFSMICIIWHYLRVWYCPDFIETCSFCKQFGEVFFLKREMMLCFSKCFL